MLGSGMPIWVHWEGWRPQGWCQKAWGDQRWDVETTSSQMLEMGGREVSQYMPQTFAQYQLASSFNTIALHSGNSTKTTSEAPLSQVCSSSEVTTVSQGRTLNLAFSEVVRDKRRRRRE